jgi:hypothetical protein
MGITNFSQDARIKPRLVKKLDGHIASNDANTVGVSLTEELAIDPLLLGGEIEVRLRSYMRKVSACVVFNQSRKPAGTAAG